MIDTSIAVCLKAPDPASMTALSTLRRISPDICPERLERYDHWRFAGPGAGEELVRETVSHFPDIVNPNKQTWSFFDVGFRGRTDDPGLTWVAVLITDRVDSVSENWSGIIGRRCPGIHSVRFSVLWRLGFKEGVPVTEARDRTMKMAVTTHRDLGLLGNPVSQEIELLGTCRN